MKAQRLVRKKERWLDCLQGKEGAGERTGKSMGELVELAQARLSRLDIHSDFYNFTMATMSVTTTMAPPPVSGNLRYPSAAGASCKSIGGGLWPHCGMPCCRGPSHVCVRLCRCHCVNFPVTQLYVAGVKN
eukprot:SAG31_NODE_93_length_26250_cov_47.615082_3_plen_131_part_00